MNGMDATLERRDLRPRLEAQRRRTAAREARCAPTPRLTRPATAPRPKRSRTMLTLTIAIVAGSLMMIAGYMSMSGLRNAAWEKEHPTAVRQAEPQPAAAPATSAPPPVEPGTAIEPQPSSAPAQTAGGFVGSP